MARKLQWNDEGQSVKANGEPDGRFAINSVTSASSGRVEWFLSEGPLDQAPAPCDSLEEAQALAQAIVAGNHGELESKRLADVAARRAEAQAERRRAALLEGLSDPVLLDELRTMLAKGDA